MDKEQKKEDIDKALHIANVSGSLGTSYWVTPHLRYAKKHIAIDEQRSKWELRLQQMWQGQDGSQKWEWVEVFE